jgi:DNA mismatch endonuclease (patch repair protein)
MSARVSEAPDEKRSELMRRVRQKKTSAEESVAKALRLAGIGYRRNVSTLPGSPDFANKSRKWALFVNGCFWHHHSNCKRATIPKANQGFWREKFAANRKRDAVKLRLLRRIGYRVFLVWECEITQSDIGERLRDLGRGPMA